MSTEPIDIPATTFSLSDTKAYARMLWSLYGILDRCKEVEVRTTAKDNLTTQACQLLGSACTIYAETMLSGEEPDQRLWFRMGQITIEFEQSFVGDEKINEALQEMPAYDIEVSAPMIYGSVMNMMRRLALLAHQNELKQRYLLA